MKAGVPTRSPERVIDAASESATSPKSARCGTSAASRRTFEGLTSRWTSPLSWQASSARASARPHATTCEMGTIPRRATRSESDPPV